MKTKTPVVQNNLASTTRMHWQMIRTSAPQEELLKDSLNFLITRMGMTKEKAQEQLGLS